MLEWGQAFTASGFPKSELSNAAFGMAHQAPLMFTRQTGCVLCEEEAERTGDFSVTCICTGAPSNYIKELVEKWAPGELAAANSSN